jgi:VWFA-related protein
VRGLLTTSVSAKGIDIAGTAQFDRQEASARAALLSDLAYGTGGTYFHNNNDLDLGFRQTSEMPEYVYVLGFSPQRLDGKFHKLKIQVKGATKLTVQARPGYYALKPASGS